MLRLGLSILLGLLFVYSGSSLPAAGTLALLCGVLSISSLLLRREALLVVLGFSFGLGSGWVAASNRLENRLPPSQAGEILEVEGRIVSLVEIAGERQKFLLAPADLSLPQLIRLTAYSPEPVFRAGERWRLTVKLREPRGFANPAGFDIERWYFREGIGAIGYVRSDPAAVRLEPSAGWLSWRERVLAAIEARTSFLENAGLVRALAAGDRRFLDDADWQLLRETGTSHLVAISGLHLSLVALIFAAALKFLLPVRLVSGRRWRWLKLFLIEMAISLYAVLAGLETPVQRAWIMVTLGLLAIAVAHRFRWSAIYGLALTVVLLLDPLAPLDVGFWLSFMAVAAILFGVGGVVRIRTGWLTALDLQWRLSLLLLPLTLASFSLLAPAGFAANLVAIPITGFLLLPILLLALLSWPLEPVSQFLFGLADSLFGLLVRLLAALGEILPVQVMPLALPSLLLLACGLILVLLPRPFGLRYPGILVLTVFCLLAGRSQTGDLGEGDWRITVLDVGQGTAVLIQTRKHLLVYDTGPAFQEGSAAESVVIPTLQSLATKPDAILVSHQDSDHAGGLEILREYYPRSRIMMGDTCTAGTRWQWDGVSFEILHPQAGEYWSDNNGSCVLRINGRNSALLPGDIEAAAEAALVAQGLQPSDFVLAPHHGSNTSSTAGFVKASAPSLVIFPAGHGNRWKFPRAPVLERWHQIGATTWTTGSQGAITIISDRNGMHVERWRASSPRLWRYPPVAEQAGSIPAGPEVVR